MNSASDALRELAQMRDAMGDMREAMGNMRVQLRSYAAQNANLHAHVRDLRHVLEGHCTRVETLEGWASNTSVSGIIYSSNEEGYCRFLLRNADGGWAMRNHPVEDVFMVKMLFLSQIKKKGKGTYKKEK